MKIRGLVYLLFSIIFAFLLINLPSGSLALLIGGFMCVGLFLIGIPYIFNHPPDVSSDFSEKFNTTIDICIAITLYILLTSQR